MLRRTQAGVGARAEADVDRFCDRDHGCSIQRREGAYARVGGAQAVGGVDGVAISRVVGETGGADGEDARRARAREVDHAQASEGGIGIGQGDSVNDPCGGEARAAVGDITAQRRRCGGEARAGRGCDDGDAGSFIAHEERFDCAAGTEGGGGEVGAYETTTEHALASLIDG